MLSSLHNLHETQTPPIYQAKQISSFISSSHISVDFKGVFSGGKQIKIYFP